MSALAASPAANASGRPVAEQVLGRATGTRSHFAILVRCAPFVAYMVLLALNAWIGALLQHAGIDARWAYGVRVSAAGALLLCYWRFYAELHALRADVRHIALAIAVGIAVLVAWVNLDVFPLALPHSGGFDPRSAGAIDWPLALVRVAGAAIIVPLMEELFWRSFVMRWLQSPRFLTLTPDAVGARAILFSAIAFGLEHHLWFAGILAGLAYGWLYVRTGALWMPVIAHAVTNFGLAMWVLSSGRWEFW